MADHLEIEQKFDVDDDFRRPDFGMLPGYAAAAPVTHHLSATYYDTPDTRLAANKITLRRRTGGTDAGWHLKLPAGAGARRELQVPLSDGPDRDTVPERLAARVAEVTGGLPLAPIATLDTERTVVTLTIGTGDVAAEIADDKVTARRLAPRPGLPLRWREIEVEVPVRSPELQEAAAKLLVSAGARPAVKASKLAKLLAS
ncbi:MAG TPA: CYTH domain-containing protein [Trebonia sp.]